MSGANGGHGVKYAMTVDQRIKRMTRRVERMLSRGWTEDSMKVVVLRAKIKFLQERAQIIC